MSTTEPVVVVPVRWIVVVAIRNPTVVVVVVPRAATDNRPELMNSILYRKEIEQSFSSNNMYLKIVHGQPTPG